MCACKQHHNFPYAMALDIFSSEAFSVSLLYALLFCEFMGNRIHHYLPGGQRFRGAQSESVFMGYQKVIESLQSISQCTLVFSKGSLVSDVRRLIMIKHVKADIVATFIKHCRLERSGKGESKLVFLLLRTSANINSVQVQCRFLSA